MNGKEALFSSTIIGLIILLAGPVFGLDQAAAEKLGADLSPILSDVFAGIGALLVFIGRFKAVVKPITSVFGVKIRQ